MCVAVDRDKHSAQCEFSVLHSVLQWDAVLEYSALGLQWSRIIVSDVEMCVSARARKS